MSSMRVKGAGEIYNLHLPHRLYLLNSGNRFPFLDKEGQGWFDTVLQNVN
ncbi:hypothetical protein L1278_003974 [Pontibacter sp. HSC-36F09]|nr:hypothetical protein [Pontibacter sp. HSC-36F09]